MSLRRRFLRIGLTSLSVLVLLVAGLWASTDIRFRHTLHWLERADPVQEARAALARGDRRLAAVSGIGISAPGVPDFYAHYDRYQRENGLRVIPFTSDVILSEDQQRLDSLAVLYARAYNPVILGLVR